VADRTGASRDRVFLARDVSAPPVLAIVPLRPFREFAFIMALGVLIDSFPVSSLLVPALISLVGDASAWPAKRFGVPRVVETGEDGR
jgi:uncharacterized membrane protein YdfJ with MMPL/SSD domain